MNTFRIILLSKQRINYNGLYYIYFQISNLFSDVQQLKIGRFIKDGIVYVYYIIYPYNVYIKYVLYTHYAVYHQ